MSNWKSLTMLARTNYYPLMAKLVFGMSQSLDGYVDDAAGTLCMPAPGPEVFRHFLDIVAGHTGAIYGRRIYELMRYWDVDRPEWDVAQREFAAAWRRQPKWVASRTLASVGPNATLIRGDLNAYVRDLKATVDGELDVAGPELAAAIAPLIDEYRLYFRPYVLMPTIRPSVLGTQIPDGPGC